MPKPTGEDRDSPHRDRTAPRNVVLTHHPAPRPQSKRSALGWLEWMRSGLDLACLAELSRLGRFGEVSGLRTLSRYAVGRHYRGLAAAAWAAVILGGGRLGSSSLRRSRSSISSGSGWVVRVSSSSRPSVVGMCTSII